MSAINRVIRQMRRLGRLDSPHDIAHLLWRESILGTPHHGRTCPLSVYLRIKTGAEWVAVSTKFTWVVHGTDGLCIANPEMMRHFVMLLDDGAYPPLEWKWSLTTDSLPVQTVIPAPAETSLVPVG